MPSTIKGRYAGTAVYTVPGLNSDRCKELPGLYLSESEGARYWLEVLAGLNNRGIKDILTACANGLAGFDEAVRSIFPQTGVQLCVTRQIRNSLRCVASKGQKAETHIPRSGGSGFGRTGRGMERKYPKVIQSWRSKRPLLSACFRCPG
ncbi:IS256 family transposase, partial [Neisseria iguanae]